MARNLSRILPGASLVKKPLDKTWANLLKYIHMSGSVRGTGHKSLEGFPVTDEEVSCRIRIYALMNRFGCGRCA